MGCRAVLLAVACSGVYAQVDAETEERARLRGALSSLERIGLVGGADLERTAVLNPPVSQGKGLPVCSAPHRAAPPRVTALDPTGEPADDRLDSESQVREVRSRFTRSGRSACVAVCARRTPPFSARRQELNANPKASHMESEYNSPDRVIPTGEARARPAPKTRAGAQLSTARSARRRPPGPTSRRGGGSSRRGGSPRPRCGPMPRAPPTRTARGRATRFTRASTSLCCSSPSAWMCPSWS
jgi:hypothetical protein